MNANDEVRSAARRIKNHSLQYRVPIPGVPGEYFSFGEDLQTVVNFVIATPAPPSEADNQTRDRMGTGCTHHGDEPTGHAGSTPAGRIDPPPAVAGGELPDEPGMWNKPQWGSVLVMRDEDRPVAQVWDDRAGSLAGSRMAIELLPRGNWRKSAAAAGEVERLRDELSTSEAAATAEAIFADELNAKLTQAHARIAALEVSAKELMRQLDSANRRYDNQRDKATHFQLKVASLEARVRELTPDPPAHAYDPSVIRS